MAKIESTEGNSGLAKVAVQFSADTFVVNIATLTNKTNTTAPQTHQL